MKLLTLIACLALVSATQKRYDGHKVITVRPTTELQLRVLAKLESDAGLDFFTDIRLNAAVDIHLTPEEFDSVTRKLLNYKLDYDIKISDLQELTEQSRLEHDARVHARRGEAFPLDVYHSYDEMTAWFKELESSYGNIVTLGSMGKSLEGRDQWEFTITGGAVGDKPINWIDCNIHAREWVAGTACCYYVNELVTKYGKDDAITEMVDNYEWVIVPMFNPDGYEYSRNTDRYWRKNRNLNPESEKCEGVDLNRNFDINWSGSGSSTNPCSETYCGTAAFSEIETMNQRDRIKGISSRLNMAFSMHSYSQLLMCPWAYTTEAPADLGVMSQVGEVAVNAILWTNTCNYQFGQVATLLYSASGITIDWIYKETGCPYIYTIEMRDQGYFGFELPEDQILLNANETWKGITTTLTEIQKIKY